MARMMRPSILAVLLLSLAPFSAFGQYLSGIDGTVRDKSGAVVANAKVTITDNRLQVAKTATTSDVGYFRIDSIAASTYTVRIELSGFKTWEQRDVEVPVGQIRTVAPALEVGSITTDVTVSATAEVAVNLVTADTGSVISEQTIQQTPLAGQNVYAITTLTPGITGSGVTSRDADNFTNEYAININAAGLRQEQNGYSIDGAQTNTPSRGGGTSISPNPAIVQSVEVRTNDFDTGKGRNGGAIVNVFTRSGSNQLHGNVDYYFTNNNLSALTHYDGSALPPSKRNEISAAVGGPAIKNKLFWFGAIDVLRSSVTTPGSATVETQELYDWVKTNMASTVAFQALTLAPPIAYASSSGATPVSGVSGSHFPIPAGIPSNLPAFGNINFTSVAPKNGYQWSFRSDYYMSDKDRFYVDAIRTYDTASSTSPRPKFAAPNSNHSTFANVDWTHTFGPRLLNEAGINIIRPYGQLGASPAFQVPNINVSGIQGFGNWGPGNFTQQTVGWRDVLRATVKSHSLKFGFEQLNIREADSQGGAFDRPTFNFNSILDFIQDGAVHENGTPVNLLTHQEAPYDRHYRALYSGFYVQDDWKVSSRLTLNAGVRADQMKNFFSLYSPTLSNFRLGQGNDLFTKVANGVVGINPSGHRALDHDLWGVNPRLGFAFDVFGKGKTSLRGGVGMFSDQPPYLHITDMTSVNLPNYYFPSLDVSSGATINFQLCQPPQGFSISCPVLPTNNVTIDPTTGALFVSGVLQRAGLGGFVPNYKLTQVLAWSLSLQQELQRNLIFEINYSATAAHHLPIYNQDVNRFDGDMVVNNGALTRLNPNFSQVQFATTDGNSSGNFGSASLRRRFSGGLTFGAIYTYGKAIDEVSNAMSLDSGALATGPGGGGAGPVFENGNLRGQRARADYDIRHQFAFDFTWQTPKIGSQWQRSLASGWTFSGIWLLQSGLPFTVYNGQAFAPVFDSGGNLIGNTGGDYNADGSPFDMPNLPSFGRHLSNPGKSKYLNGLFSKSDFPVPTLGQQGNLGRNTYDNEGYDNFNLTVGRVFGIGERLKIEGRGEFFNLFNRANLIGVNGDLSAGNFGKTTSQLPARRSQMHLRATF